MTGWLAQPYGVDARGRTALASEAGHLRDLIEAVLFTAPGERVHRPTFGSGLLELVFAPNDEALAAAVRASTQAALQEWLGDRIQLTRVEVVAEAERMVVTVAYTDRGTEEQRVEAFTRARGGGP